MITYVTIPFQVKELTNSPLAVGLLGLCELLPLLFMAFVGGALADYVDRRKLIIASEFAFMVLTALLLVNALAGEGLFYAAPAVGSLLVTLTSGWTARIHRHGLAVVLAAALPAFLRYDGREGLARKTG